MGLAPAMEESLSEELALSHLARCTATFTLHLLYAQWRQDLALSSTLFARRYSGYPFWFLFHRLFICLNLAGNLAWSEVDKNRRVLPITMIGTRSESNTVDHWLDWSFDGLTCLITLTIDRWPTGLVVSCRVMSTVGQQHDCPNQVSSTGDDLVSAKSVEYSNSIFGILDSDLYKVFNFIPTLRQTKPRERPEAAICVRKSSARRVLHFTPLNAASCVLHRPANRVIHRLQLYFTIVYLIWKFTNST